MTQFCLKFEENSCYLCIDYIKIAITFLNDNEEIPIFQNENKNFRLNIIKSRRYSPKREKNRSVEFDKKFKNQLSVKNFDESESFERKSECFVIRSESISKTINFIPSSNNISLESHFI